MELFSQHKSKNIITSKHLEQMVFFGENRFKRQEGDGIWPKLLMNDLVLSSVANLTQHFLSTLYRVLYGMQYKWDSDPTFKEFSHQRRRQNPVMGQSKARATKAVHTGTTVLHIRSDTIYGAKTGKGFTWQVLLMNVENSEHCLVPAQIF